MGGSSVRVAFDIVISLVFAGNPLCQMPSHRLQGSFTTPHRETNYRETKTRSELKKKPPKTTWKNEKKKKKAIKSISQCHQQPQLTPPSSKLFDVLLGGSLGKLKAFHHKSHSSELHTGPTKAPSHPSAPAAAPKSFLQSYLVTLERSLGAV